MNQWPVSERFWDGECLLCWRARNVQEWTSDRKSGLCGPTMRKTGVSRQLHTAAALNVYLGPFYVSTQVASCILHLDLPPECSMEGIVLAPHAG